MRVGIGYDIHAFKKGRALVLGGVPVPYTRGLAGHSDGDVLLHAILDAALGAMAEGDLGDHFPDTEKRWKGCESGIFVKKILGLLKERKFALVHIDATLIAEEPRLEAYKHRIRTQVAQLFGLALPKVNVKAKTNEGLGAVGERKGIACLAAVTIENR